MQANRSRSPWCNMTTKAPPPPPAPPAQPPDERFWVKYSPHHEMTISGMASLAWHTLAVVVVVVFAVWVANGERNDMPIEAIQLGGGGGPLDGVGDGSAVGPASALVEAIKSDSPSESKSDVQPSKDVGTLQITPKNLLKDLEVDKDAERELLKISERGSEVLNKLSKLDGQMRKALMGGKGQGGPGSGGGNGTGNGPIAGPGDGPGGTLNVRTKRKLRWTITFNTQSGSDYLHQLHVLGAILAFNTPDGQLKCVKNLMQRPVKLETEDLQKLNRIFWIDDNRGSVEQLVRAMGLDFVPNQVVALFTPELEKELLRAELGYQNKKEEEIAATWFQIQMRGNNYSVIVTQQRLF